MVITTKHYNITIPSLNPFTWKTKRTELETPTKTDFYHPVDIDWTDSLVASYELLDGAYRAEKGGLKLAAFAIKKIIDKPLQFMGIPIPKSNNEQTEKELIKWTENNAEDIKNIEKESALQGTCWVFPRYDADIKDVVLEFIPDHTVKLIRDLTTRKIIQIITSENITIAVSLNQDVTLTRTRIFTKETISIKWEGDKTRLQGQAENVEYRNVLGIMPIPFANRKKAGEVRGYSDLTNVLPQLKAYHDIVQKVCAILSKFNPKLVAGVTDVKAWKENNGITTLDELDIATRDLFLYLVSAGEIKPEIIFPSTMTEPYIKMLEILFLQIVEGCDIPEMLWGAIVTGNHATATENMADMIKFIHDKQSQYNNSFITLLGYIARLKNLAGMRRAELQPITIEWNDLDAVSEEVRMKIFNEFASAFTKLYDSAGMTFEQAYELWNNIYPKITEDEFDAWKKKLLEVAEFNQFKKASLIDAAGGEGFENVETGQEREEDGEEQPEDREGEAESA
jgi:hypothetical protein